MNRFQEDLGFMKRATIAVLISCACIGLVQSVLAQKTVIPLAVEDALSQKVFPAYMPISLSPDAQWIGYTLQNLRNRTTIEGTKYQFFSPTGVSHRCTGGEVWLTNTKTNETVLLDPINATSSWAPVWSPDGNYLAFYSDSGGTAHLWVWEKASRKARQVSDAIIRPFSPLHVPRWTNNSKKIVTRILPYGTTIEDGEKAVAAAINQSKTFEQDTKTTVTVFDAAEQQGKAAGSDYISAQPADLALIDIATGAVRTIAKGFRPSAYWISPDGQNLAFTHNKGYEAPNTSQSVYDLVVVSLDSVSEPRIVASNVRQEFGFNVSWSPDSKLLSYTTSGVKADGECFLIPINGGEPRPAAVAAHPNFGSSFRPALWDATGRFLYFLTAQGALWKVSVAGGQSAEVAHISNRTVLDIVWTSGKSSFWSRDGGRSLVLTTRDTEDKQVGFYEVNLNTGNVTRLIEQNKNYGFPINYTIDFSADGQSLVYIAEDAAHPADIWISDATFSNPRQVTLTSLQFEHYQFGKSRLVEWRSVDGQKLKGTLLLPAGYKQGERYPLIVYPYPTSTGSNYLNRFGIQGAGAENMQLFATRGYAVFFPDNVIHEGTTMKDLAKSILPGVDKVVEMGVADNDRTGVMGHSWGGYTVLSLIVQTTRFKAAIMRAGYGNIISMYGAMGKNGSPRGQALYEKDAGHLGLGGTLWQFRDRYVENSPVFYLDKVETPLLIIHGSSDIDAAVHLADETFVDLRRLGKKVVYARYGGEAHNEISWGYANQVDYVNRIINWFDSHLKVTSR
jgi:dipeptidyl aminopeptidase/acylaminoacyl peptidase